MGRGVHGGGPGDPAERSTPVPGRPSSGRFQGTLPLASGVRRRRAAARDALSPSWERRRLLAGSGARPAHAMPQRGGRRPPASPSAREPTSRPRRPRPAARSEPPCTRQRCTSRRRALPSRASARRPRRRTLPRRDRRSAWQRRRTRCRPSSLPPLDRHAIGAEATGRAQGTFANAGPRRRSGPTLQNRPERASLARLGRRPPSRGGCRINLRRAPWIRSQGGL